MISITLPSLYPETLVSCLENLDASTAGRFEVIVVGPHQPRVGIKNGDLVWIEERPEEARGIAAAHEKAFAAAAGEFIFAYADDHLLEGGWDNAALVEFNEREGRTREHLANIFCLGLRETPPHDEVHVSFGRYYANFPIMRRRDVNALRGWLSGKFKVGYSDTDLSLRVWHAGGRCEWSKCRPLRPTQQNTRAKEGGASYEALLHSDMQTLFHRWPEIASEWTPNYKTNPERHPGRDFNVSIGPGMALFDEDGRTVFCPDPRIFWTARELRSAFV